MLTKSISAIAAIAAILGIMIGMTTVPYAQTAVSEGGKFIRTAHTFNGPLSEDDPESVFFCFVYEVDATGNDLNRCFSTLEVCQNHREAMLQREGVTVLSECERFDGLA